MRKNWVLWISLVALIACIGVGCGNGTGGGGGTGVGALQPKNGRWEGSDLSFRLEGSQIKDLVLSQHQCTGDNGCTDKSVVGPIAGAWPTAMTWKATAPGGSISGNYISETQVVGTLKLQAGTCCSVVAAWEAHWIPDGDAGVSGDGSAADAGGDAGKADAVLAGTDAIVAADVEQDVPVQNSANWNGESLGTIHPGPAQNNASPAPPAGLTTDQQDALALLNDYRNAVGSPVVTENVALSKACKAHADFYVAHFAKYQSSGLSPHEEDSSYGSGFTGIQFWDRDAAAGYQAQGQSNEVIAFVGDPAGALQGWIDTVYHRLPLLDPTTQEIGYGAAGSGQKAVDVIDSGGRSAKTSDPIIVWPWPGQHNVPSSWNGLEGPQPQAPPTGWPSGPVITAQFPKPKTIKTHELLSPAEKTIAHTWLDVKTDPNLANDANTMALYANKPLANGTYTVRLTLTTGEVLAWRFTVGP